jgi:hypothetical protein
VLQRVLPGLLSCEPADGVADGTGAAAEPLGELVERRFFFIAESYGQIT